MKDPGKVFSETVTEIPEMPKVVTTQHMAYRYTCAGCGRKCFTPSRKWAWWAR